MPDDLETILRLVAEGKLAPEEAASLIAAVQKGRTPGSQAGGPAAAGAGTPGGQGRGLAGSGRRMRIRVTEEGRDVVDVRVPLALAGLATDRVPGLSEANRTRIRQALDQGLVGPILEIRDGGDEVRIVVE